MLLDEYVDFRVRTGESERLRVERERARRVREHAGWLQSVLRRHGAAGGGEAAAPVATDVPEPAPLPERELAHAGR